MFRSAAFKLTLSYLALIMGLSISFSLVIYNISSSELGRGLRHQTSFMQAPPPNFFSFEEFREQQLTEERTHLRNNLLLLNLATLLLGGGVSYALARRTLEPIEEAMEAQSRFTADASHELRTPLTAMQTEIEVALRDPKLTSAASRELLASNLEEVAKLKALAEGLLRLAQQDGKGIPLQPVMLKGVIDEAMGRIEALAKAKGVTLAAEGGGWRVLGDQPSLVELLVILLDNAIKYSPPNGVVTISAKAAAKMVQMTVKDEGEGIHAADLPHVFERFYRADTSRTKGDVNGYGLGLSIAKKIAELHHGSIEASSTPGHGATFTVKLQAPSA